MVEVAELDFGVDEGRDGSDGEVSRGDVESAAVGDPFGDVGDVDGVEPVDQVVADDVRWDDDGQIGVVVVVRLENSVVEVVVPHSFDRSLVEDHPGKAQSRQAHVAGGCHNHRVVGLVAHSEIQL